MYDIDRIDTREHSVTATVCENARLFGATPERGEFDPRDVWDRDHAIDAVGEAFRILSTGVAPDGVQLADERESLLWGFVNCLDAQVRRLDRGVDRLAPELRDLQAAQDGSEVKSRALELVTDRAQSLGERRDAFEQMRDAAAEHYRAETGGVWRPRRGSHTSQTGHLTSAAIDARDFLRARNDREMRAHLPQGTLSGLKWAGLSAAAQAVASLAILAALSRLLTPADFGVVAMALVFVAAAQVLGHRSLGSAIVQRHELGDRHVAAALTLSVAAAAVLAGALWLLAPAIGRLLAEPAVAPALGALTIAIAISGPATVPEFLLRRRLRFRALAAAELSSQVLGYGLVAIALAAHGFGVWALVWGAVARQGVFAAAVLAGAPRLPRPGLARRETGEVLRAGAGFSSIAFFDLVAHQGSRLVVGRLLGAASLGHYTRATALAVFAGCPG